MGKEVYGCIELGKGITMETITKPGEEFSFLDDDGNEIQCITLIKTDDFDQKKYIGQILTDKGRLSLNGTDDSSKLLAVLETV